MNDPVHFLHHLFDQQVEKTPDQVAVSFGSQQVTYREVHERSNQMAHFLRARGLQRSEPVAIMLERSVEMVITLLGVLKSGAAFVPLDPKYPSDRLAMILEEIAPRWVLTQDSFTAKLHTLLETAGLFEVHLLLTTSPATDGPAPDESAPDQLSVHLHHLDALNSFPTGNLDVVSEPDDLNYIFYTSGSTGRPKGVMGCHKSLAHFISWEIDEFGLGAGERVSQFAALSFDACLRDLFVPLCSGGTVCLPPQEAVLDRESLVQWIEAERLTLVHCVPSVFRQLLAELMTMDADARAARFPHLRKILMAGEVLEVKHVQQWMEIFGTRIQLVNLYGSTETTMIKMFHRIEKLPPAGKPIPVGRAMRGAAPLILNDKQKLCGIGQVGEIYIRSPYLALGYYKRPDLTEGVFLQNPLQPGQPDRVYRTGDLGRYLPDGTVEYIGRKDNQVKVRGIRVELGEIEAALTSAEGVREGIAVARAEEDGDCTLIAYFTGATTGESLRAFLQQKLPEAMIPQQFHRLDELPLLPNGKIDRKALQALAVEAKPELASAYVEPATETEKLLAGIWADVLKLEKVGTRDGFFALGGHSLLAMQAIARIREAAQVRVSLQDFFNASTVEALAAHLDTLSGTASSLAIPRLPAQKTYELSHAQSRLWFLQQLDPQNVSYHMPYSVVVQGELQVEAFTAAVQRLTERHEILRTVFAEEEGVPYQAVLDHVEAGIAYHDLLHLPADEQESVWRACMDEDARTPFDLTTGPLIRLHLFRVGESEHRFYLNTHHIISDGWSTGLFVQELAEFYHALTHGQEAELNALPLRYVDYAAWQNEQLASGQLSGEEAYWLQTLAKPLPTLNLPLDFERPPVLTDTGAQFSRPLDAALVERAQKFARREDASLFMVLLSAYQLLLHRLSGDEDIIVGTPTAGRTTRELESLLGAFLNMLSIRVRFDGVETFRALLEQVKARCVEAFDHQSYPFDLLVEKVQPERDLSRSAVFSTMFVFENAPFEMQMPGLQISAATIHRQASQFDLAMKVLENEGGLELYFEYNPDLFRASSVEKLAEQFVRLLDVVLEDAEVGLYDVDLLTDVDLQLYAQMNDTAVEYDLDHLLFEAFVETAQAHPERIALRDQERTMTYGELDARSNALAHFLRARGVQRNQLVGIMMERSIEMMVGLYGILKSGGAYVPIDPEYPEQRIQYMLADSGAHVLLTKQAYLRQVLPQAEESNGAAHSLESVLLFDDLEAAPEVEGLRLHVWSDLAGQPTTQPAVVNEPDDLAYMIYTSGSTGQPKGVLIQHRAILNRLYWHQDTFQLTPEDVVIQRTSVSFDDSVIELFWPLRHGAALSIMPQEIVVDADRLIAQLVRDRATYMQFVPSLLAVVVSALQSLPTPEQVQLRTIIVSGEALPSKLVEQWFALYPNTKLANLYGPTEAAVDVSGAIYEAPQALITIGKPIANTQLYVLNPGGKLCPVRVTGELYVGGVQLAAGYHNKPEKTAESFVANALPGTPGDRLYRTGDSVRLLPDGNIEYLGRVDNQVKVRGFRIELGEIEDVLMQAEGVEIAAVIARKGADGINALCGFYTAASELEASAIKDFLRRKLPEYMVPPRLFHLDAMPLTPNGKVDRKALEALAGDAAHESVAEYLAPVTATEQTLAGIWSELLGRGQVGLGDHFFELGGHSLLLMQVNSRISRTLDVRLTLKDLFAYPTLGELAAHIDSLLAAGRSQEVVRIESASAQEHYELSHAQKRLWFLYKFDPSNTAYHVNLNVRLLGGLNEELFEAALQEMVRRHSSLRTVFREVDGYPRQFVQETSPFRLEYADWMSLSAERQHDLLRAKLRETEAQPFDLHDGPLMRAMLYRIGAEEYQFLLQKHHIITDAWSRDLFLKELQEAYAALVEGREAALAPVELQYVDYAEWQARQVAEGVLEQEQAYWLNVLAKPLPILDLPTDFPRPEVQTYNGGLVAQVLAPELAAEIRRATQQEGVSMFMFLFAAYVQLLHHLTGNEDIIVGTTIAGRTAEQLESVFGFFVNTLALRVRLEEVRTPSDLLNTIKQLSVEAYEHQSIPFDQLIEAINPERDMSRSPIFSTMFQYEIGMSDGLRGEQFTIELAENPFEVLTSKFDLQLNMMDFEEQGLHLFFQYNSDLFTQETVEKFTDLFLQVLKAFVQDRQAPLHSLELLTDGDRAVYAQMNDTAAEYDLEGLLFAAFAEQAQAHPERIALSDRGRTMTYGELHERSNRLAHFLRGQGVQRNQLVAILMERSIETMVGLYGILKSGAAYVPIDPEYPAQRIQYMLEDSGAHVLLTKQAYLRQVLPQAEVPSGAAHSLKSVLLFDDMESAPEVEGLRLHVWRELAELPTTQPATVNEPDDLAYMIYTSGSTGQPKGVLIQHRAILNRLFWHQDTFQLTPDDVVIQRTTVCFDDSVIELFWPLRHGAKLSIMPQDVVLDSTRLLQQLVDERATYMQFVPSLLAVVVSALQELPPHERPRLRTIIVSGEALPSKLVEQWFALYPDTTLANLYGPTEAAVDVSGAIYTSPQALITIGKPLANTQLYVLNAHGQLCPVNVKGELYVGGVQLAVGYHNKPEKTAESFVPNALPGTVGERLYRTGDAVRLLPDGNIEYLGRVDNQVKIRGFRIELGEIEEVLTQVPDVEIAAVIAQRGPDGNNALFGYYTAAREALETAELKQFLRAKLPDYMVPPRLVQLETMPLTPNGKVDRKVLEQLAARDEFTAVAEYIAPSTATEQMLAAIWSEFLKRETIGVSDNFFDLGGHSLLAIQILNRVRTEYQTALELKDLFANPTISELAAALDQLLADGQTQASLQIPKAPEQAHYALSNAQKRLWFTHKLYPDSRAYNVPLEIAIKRSLDVQLFERALEAVVQRHDALRTVFVEIEGEPRQLISTERGMHFFYKDVSGLSEHEQTHYIRESIAHSDSKPFDLAHGPLMRTMLFKRGEEQYHFYLSLHHIITDGWSNELLAREHAVIYEALEAGVEPPLADLALQYTDYSEWQVQEASTGSFEADEAYWVETLAKPLPLLALPTDFPRPEIQTDHGATVWMTIPPELHDTLRARASEEGVSMFMLLLAGYVLFLHQHTQQDDLIVGTPIAGRLTEELEPLIGFFVNTLAIRTRLDEVVSVRDLVQAIKQQSLQAFEHQAYPFDLLIEKVNPERDLSRTPIFSTMFTYRQAIEEQSPLYEPLLEEEQGVAKFDLSVAVNETAAGLRVGLEYNTDLFRPETIEQFAKRWQLALEVLASEPSANVRELSLLTEEDRALYARVNDTFTESSEELWYEAFVRQAEADPERVALRYEGQSMSYGELHERSNRLANFLREQGVQRNELVAVLMERSLEAVVGIYGIMKAGAAYLALDPEYPEGRNLHTLNHSEARVLLTKSEQLSTVQSLNEAGKLTVARVILLNASEDTAENASENVSENASENASGTLANGAAGVPITHWHQVAASSAETPEIVNDPADLAYVIYTSGSTGTPKGVRIPHRSLTNFVDWLQRTIPLDESDALAQRTSLCFDASVHELFWPLRSGARMVIIPTATVLDTSHLHQVLVEERVTAIQFVPTLFSSFLYGLQSMGAERAQLPSMRWILSGGEILPIQTVNQWYELFGSGVKILTQYGPTEATVDASCHILEGPQDTTIPIGTPIANTHFYVLNAQRSLLPVGVSGELYIGGIGLGQGYHNDPEKTAAVYVPHPFAPGERLYKTGDIARLKADGTFECLGRTDSQVKVRGFRIELGEIEEVLHLHPDVEHAALIAKPERDGTHSLAGFYTSTREDLQPAELKSYLSSRLPNYMVPPQLARVDALPYMPNGKVDRQALHRFHIPLPAAAVAKPANELQAEILEIWQDVLQHQSFGVDDNFFDIGGHSIALAKVHSSLKDKLGLQLPMTDLFKYPTIRTLADSLTAAKAKPALKLRDTNVRAEDDAVAIIGIGLRFPDASTPTEFWENLRNGYESVREFPLEELDVTPFNQDPDELDQLIRVAALLQDIDMFDAEFFGISEKEALLMHPQHRLFLECAWEAIEDAGYNVDDIDARVSVYAGAGGYEYLPRSGAANLSRAELFQAILSSQPRFLTTRVSYKMNLTGESLYVDTACSTSLVAVHMACQSLLHHQSDYALAGGVSIQLPQKAGYVYEPGFVNSEDGHCRAFDKDASGTANGSGSGLVFLKRLSDAQRDGDPIYAVIKGSAINNDGNLKIGYTAPSETGQSLVIAEAQAAAGVKPEDITYIEAHGTATILGDPIEVTALTNVFRQQTDRRQFCALGSVKTNIGHLDSAAGVAGLIKTALALKHRELPPSLNFKEPNPALKLEESPFYVNVSHKPWEPASKVRRAGVSSFGIGGTNAHVILEEAPPEDL
jgi:amino acid adenylation domain-containing protein